MRLLIIVLVVALSGCVSTGNKLAGICQVEENVIAFDKSREVVFTKCWSPSGESVWDVPSIKMGFAWNESKPEQVRLNLVYDSSVSGNAYTLFERVSLNIDGDRKNYNVNSRTQLSDGGYNNVSNTIYTTSAAFATIPFSVFEDMMTKEDVRVRIYTSDGYEDQLFHVESMGMSQYTRKLAQPYLERVKQIKG